MFMNKQGITIYAMTHTYKPKRQSERAPANYWWVNQLSGDEQVAYNLLEVIFKPNMWAKTGWDLTGHN